MQIAKYREWRKKGLAVTISSLPQLEEAGLLTPVHFPDTTVDCLQRLEVIFPRLAALAEQHVHALTRYNSTWKALPRANFRTAVREIWLAHKDALDAVKTDNVQYCGFVALSVLDILPKAVANMVTDYVSFLPWLSSGDDSEKCWYEQLSPVVNERFLCTEKEVEKDAEDNKKKTKRKMKKDAENNKRVKRKIRCAGSAMGSPYGI